MLFDILTRRSWRQSFLLQDITSYSVALGSGATATGRRARTNSSTATTVSPRCYICPYVWCRLSVRVAQAPKTSRGAARHPFSLSCFACASRPRLKHHQPKPPTLEALVAESPAAESSSPTSMVFFRLRTGLASAAVAPRVGSNPRSATVAAAKPLPPCASGWRSADDFTCGRISEFVAKSLISFSLCA